MYNCFRDNMVYWEFLVARKLEFTQFDPVVAEKHSGSQGLNWEGNSTKRVENELNWIKSLTKSDVIGIRIGLDSRVIANFRPLTSFCYRSEISES